MHLKIHHVTRYRFSEPVTFGLQQLRKTPKTSLQQSVRNWRTQVTGGVKELSFRDHHHNMTELISFDRGAVEVEIVSEGDVELNNTHGVVGAHRGPSPLWLYRASTPQTEAKAGVRALLRENGSDMSVEGLHALSATIRKAVRYEIGASHPDWTAEDALAAGKGVCQDHTHVFIACVRALEIPCRYVSGYLMLNDRVTQQAMHAWAEAYLPDLGWVGFDISNGISPDARYVRVATGADYRDAAPVSGTRIGGADEALEVQIEVAQQ